MLSGGGIDQNKGKQSREKEEEKKENKKQSKNKKRVTREIGSFVLLFL